MHDADRGELRLYVDGVRQSAVPYATPRPSTGPLIVGRARFANTPVDFWPGLVDTVRAYDRPLTDDEVADLYKATT